ncbi:MAG: hypothetical protein ABIR71_00735 [Chthoniobacterales bacterium]
MWRFALVFFLTLTVARGERQSTAYDALQVVGNQFGRTALKRIISVTGVDGDPQPTNWTVLLADRNAAGGVRELQVADGRILANRTPGGRVAGTTEGATINTAQLNLDSSGAFTVASHTADRAHTNFDSVSYTLRTSDRGTPVWIVTVLDQARNPVGTIHISAHRGNVTRVEGMYRGANMANVEQDPVAQEALRDDNARPSEPEIYDEGEIVEDGDGDENIVKARIKQMFRRTKREAQGLFQRVRRPFDEFIDRRRR